MKTRTTIILEREHLRQLKAVAARDGRTLTSVIAECIREGLARFRQRGQQRPRKPVLTSHDLGALPFNVESRREMYDFFDREGGDDLR